VYLEQKRKYVYVCVRDELLANFTEKDHRLAHQLREVTALTATYLSEDEGSYIRETIKKDLEINKLDQNMVYDRTLWRNLNHVADPT